MFQKNRMNINSITSYPDGCWLLAVGGNHVYTFILHILKYSNVNKRTKNGAGFSLNYENIRNVLETRNDEKSTPKRNEFLKHFTYFIAFEFWILLVEQTILDNFIFVHVTIVRKWNGNLQHERVVFFKQLSQHIFRAISLKWVRIRKHICTLYRRQPIFKMYKRPMIIMVQMALQMQSEKWSLHFHRCYLLPELIKWIECWMWFGTEIE